MPWSRVLLGGLPRPYLLDACELFVTWNGRDGLNRSAMPVADVADHVLRVLIFWYPIERQLQGHPAANGQRQSNNVYHFGRSLWLLLTCSLKSAAFSTMNLVNSSHSMPPSPLTSTCESAPPCARTRARHRCQQWLIGNAACARHSSRPP